MLVFKTIKKKTKDMNLQVLIYSVFLISTVKSLDNGLAKTPVTNHYLV